MTTLLFTHPSSLRHVTPNGHPERVDRIKAVNQILANEHFKDLARREAPLGRDEDILRAHAYEHLERIRAMAPAEGMEISRPRHGDVGGLAGGGAARRGGCHRRGRRGVHGRGRQRVLRAEAARPPRRNRRAMGFCLFNQAAIAAQLCPQQHGAERVAVVDFDVHHGNGTQDIFWSDANMFYGSTHQMPLYPGTGDVQETGVRQHLQRAARAPGDGGEQFREAMNSVILPALTSSRPTSSIVSAGFDAHHRDPLGSLQLTEEDFAWATLKLMEAAEVHCGGRLVSVLEGGYDLQGLAASVGIHVQALMRGNAGMVEDGIRRRRRGRDVMTEHADIASLPFEKALAELEQIVTRLESGKVDLEQSIAIYERGEALKKHCEKLLKDAEARIEKITLKPDGTPSGTEPLDVD